MIAMIKEMSYKKLFSLLLLLVIISLCGCSVITSFNNKIPEYRNTERMVVSA